MLSNVLNQCLYNTTCSSLTKPKEYIIAKGDSGASNHYFRPEDKKVLTNIVPTIGPDVHQPDNTVLTTDGTGTVPIDNTLSKEAKKAMILPELKSSSLISMGQLCDDDCLVVLSKKKLAAIKDNKIVLEGTRNKKDGLWDIPIYKTEITESNYEEPTTHSGMYMAKRNENKISSVTRKLPRPPKPRTTPPSRQYQINAMSHAQCDKIVEQQHKLDEKKADLLRAAVTPKHHKIGVIIRKKQTHRDLARYLHATCFSPVPSTWEKAIRNNHFCTWPGLTPQLIKRNLPLTTATIQGHLHRQRQKLQSTKDNIKKEKTEITKPRPMEVKSEPHINTHPVPDQIKSAFTESNDNTQDNLFPTEAPKAEKINKVAYVLINKESIKTAYQDLTGRFPVKSSRGNEYILIGYHYDANCILGRPIKDRTAQSITNAWEHLHGEFTNAGNSPDVWVLDNEISNDFKAALKKHNTTFQLVPPHSHRRNLAERAIQTWKNHFKAGLATTDPNFPLSEWDRLIPQANITLNLLRAARANPALSAHAYIYGQFNFAATPMAPPGTKVIVHLDPKTRGTWELNGDVGWYVGPALDHYRCVTCYFPRTKTTRICDTVTFLPHDIPIPKVSLEDHLRQAADDIVDILTQPPSTTTPSLQAGDQVRNAILEIAETLKRADKINQFQQHHAQLPRVQKTVPDRVPAPLPRVSKENHPTTSTFLNRTTLPTKLKYPSTQTHRYSLRSKRTLLPTGTNFRSMAAQYLVAEEIFMPRVNHIFRPDGKKETIDTLLQGSDRKIWTRSLSNEWGRLAQGNDHGVVATDTIDFIYRHEVPQGRDITYATFVLDYRPLKSEPHRVRITVGGDRLSYAADAGSPAANLLETKLLVNSTISDAHKGARFMSLDLKDFFLATPMEGNEYMRVNYKHFPEDIKKKYNLHEKVTESGHIFIKIKRGMYGLKQAALLAYRHLIDNLAEFGYAPIKGTVGMWQHESRPTKFCVCVDDFGVKYYSKEDAIHLIESLEKNYKVTKDWEGKNYCGLTMQWHYDEGYVDVAMPKYVPDSLRRLQHVPKKYPQYSPHEHAPIRYGKKGAQQFATAPDDSPQLDPQGTKHVQSTTGSFLYYGRAIDYTILPALNAIASAQAQPTQKTKNKTQQLMDYLHTYPDAYIRYYASDMVLYVDSDAAYLVAPKARSRIAGYYYLSDHPNVTKRPKTNGAISVECKTLRHVVSSSAEAEVAGIFHNATTAVPIRHILKALNHPQPPTPLKTDNSTATGFIYDNIHQKRSKAWDMRYHWLRDRQTQQQFQIYWEKGINNDADYFTKHHATSHHRAQRAKYVRDKIKACINFLCSARVC